MLFHKLQPQFDQCSVQYQGLRYVSMRNKKIDGIFFVQYIFYSGPGRLGVHKKLPTKPLSKSHIDGRKEQHPSIKRCNLLLFADIRR